MDEFFDTAIDLPLDYDIIKKEIIKNFQGEINYVDPKNFKSVMSLTIKDKKIPIFYFPEINKNKNENIPIGINLISSDKNVLNLISFFIFENATEEILTRFNIEKVGGEMIIILEDNSNSEK